MPESLEGKKLPSVCPKCGASLDPNASFCAYCGSPVSEQEVIPPPPISSSTPPPPAPSSYPQGTVHPMSMHRPAGITILAILAGLAGLVSIGLGVGASFFGFGSFFVLIGLIELGVAFGFWTGAPWGWWLGIIGAVLDIISILSLNVLGLIIGIVILYYLTRPHVKAWFRRV